VCLNVGLSSTHSIHWFTALVRESERHTERKKDSLGIYARIQAGIHRV
jgi:hypothetical protein